MAPARSRLLFGHCFSGVQVAEGRMLSSATPESFHHRCPGVLQAEDASRALRCECECHKGRSASVPGDGVVDPPMAGQVRSVRAKQPRPAKQASSPRQTSASARGKARKEALRDAASGVRAGRSASPPS